MTGKAAKKQVPKASGTTTKSTKKTTSTPNSISSTPPGSKADGTKLSFLDLPGEIRNQVYAGVLPNREETWLWPGGSLRDDGQKTSTSFMATCKQIHDEATSLLYGSKEFEASVSRTGDIRFLGQRIAFPKVVQANFAGLNKIEVLRMSIAGKAGNTLCDVQDTLFRFFKFLRQDHKLHTLDVRIYATTLDLQFDTFSFHDVDRLSKKLPPCERGIMPGDFSRPHLAAFLTDPLRTIRGLTKGKRRGSFTLDFIGKSGKPWQAMPVKIGHLIEGDSTVPDYRLFGRYFEALRTLDEVTKGTGMRFAEAYTSGQWYARHRGDVESSRKLHGHLMKRVHKGLENQFYQSNAASYDEAKQVECKVREAMYLLQELDANLPARASDTSFYGYNEMDAALKEWQETGREDEKAEKLKRKWEKEEKGECKKRANVDADA
ncbi:hypothetical protein LTR37_002165 [Vermiconidia calcicola]|uniref:Uncharacterized protein n=1 Tax=Vermiconidia calcicola TaxID=1690605 RepID=A0ACC3NTT6_9PEZI|nr:hypothetical protein LTR37_002165 [Vermiconidia calcicola]